MTKERWQQIVRKTFEELPGHLQEYVNLRALGVPVVVWGNCTMDQLNSIYGACITARLVFLEQ